MVGSPHYNLFPAPHARRFPGVFWSGVAIRILVIVLGWLLSKLKSCKWKISRKSLIFFFLLQLDFQFRVISIWFLLEIAQSIGTFLWKIQLLLLLYRTKISLKIQYKFKHPLSLRLSSPFLLHLSNKHLIGLTRLLLPQYFFQAFR